MHIISESKTPKDLKGSWRTPLSIFKYLDMIYHFNLDAYASDENTLCDQYITEGDDAHTAPWEHFVMGGERVRAFANPPYRQPNIKLCLEKAKEEAEKRGTVVVLIPNQIADYWKDTVIGVADEVWFTVGRIAFIHPVTGLPRKENAGGNAVIVYHPRDPGTEVFTELSFFDFKHIVKGMQR